jgi:hypothetical protein
MPIDKSYAYHAPSIEGLKKINKLREAFSDLERLINDTCPTSRHKSVAITNLENAAMWAIKAVVFNDPDSVVNQNPSLETPSSDVDQK